MKYTKIGSIVMAILLCLMTVSVFGCSKKEKTPDKTEESTLPKQTEEPVTEDLQKVLEVPETLKFSGQEIHFLQRSHHVNELYAERELGDLINDTTFRRNERVKDALDVDFVFHTAEGTNHTFHKYKEAIVNSVNSGSEEGYDVVANYAYFTPPLAAEGLFYNLHELNPAKENYLSFDKIWWNQSYQKEAEINHKLYFMVGDATTSAIERLEVMFLNRNLAAARFPDTDFLQAVYDRTWTYEAMLSYIAEMGEGTDSGTWGLTMPRTSFSIDGFLASLDVDIVERNSMNLPEISFNTERTKDITLTLRELYQHNPGVLAPDGSEANQAMNKFVEGKALFHINLMLQASTDVFRNLPFKYALIPMPLWDELQSDYKSAAHDEYSSLSVLSNVMETDAVSATLEVMGCASYEMLRPALYEKCYKHKYLGTEETAKMFDYIIDNSFFDFGYIYSNVMGDPVHILRNNIRYPDKNSAVTEIEAGSIASAEKLRIYLEQIYTQL